jgi:predicted DNA-binding transcriptional regulator YafY
MKLGQPVDRLRPAKNLMRLIRLLQGHKAHGLTIGDIAARMEVSERTAHRLLAAVADIEPDLTFRKSEESQKHLWYLPESRMRISAVTALDLSTLTTVSDFLTALGHGDLARSVTALRDNLQAGLNRAQLLRLDPDLEAFDESVEVAHRPGPKATFDPALRAALLTAIVAARQVNFRYTDVRGEQTADKRISPFGIVLGPRAYLVGRDEAKGAIRNYALTGISDLVELDAPAKRDGFDMVSFVSESFGAFHDGIFRTWRLRFRSDAVGELANYQFHPTQSMTILDSGEIEVAFSCESVREVAYECLRWSQKLTSVGPAELRDCLAGILRETAVLTDQGDLARPDPPAALF